MTPSVTSSFDPAVFSCKHTHAKTHDVSFHAHIVHTSLTLTSCSPPTLPYTTLILLPWQHCCIAAAPPPSACLTIRMCPGAPPEAPPLLANLLLLRLRAASSSDGHRLAVLVEAPSSSAAVDVGVGGGGHRLLPGPDGLGCGEDEEDHRCGFILQSQTVWGGGKNFRPTHRSGPNGPSWPCSWP